MSPTRRSAGSTGSTMTTLPMPIAGAMEPPATTKVGWPASGTSRPTTTAPRIVASRTMNARSRTARGLGSW
jgi:hypothetical protein